MSIEKIQAAIDKLTRFRKVTAEHAPEPWSIGDQAPEGWGQGRGYFVVSCGPDQEGDVTDYLGPGVAELIVTLHRTIDAQLAMLKLALDYGQFDAFTQELVDAILREDS